MALKQKVIFFMFLVYATICVYGHDFEMIERKKNWVVSVYENGDSLYTIEIINTKTKKRILVEKIMSQPQPRMYWLDNDLLRIDCGSVIAPDSSSYFFSIKREKISRRIFFATAFVDLEQAKVLCADEDISVADIFNPDKNYVIILPYDILDAACYWFCIGENTKIDNGVLVLEYLVEGSYDIYKTKIYGTKYYFDFYMKLPFFDYNY